jgi:serine/threonine-protein kinase
VAYQHVHEPAPHADTGVPALDAVICKALAKERAERFQSAQAFRAAIESATETWPTTTSLTRLPPTPERTG